MENDDARQKFVEDHKIRTRHNKAQQSHSVFTENKIENIYQELGFRNLRSQNRILTTAQQNRFIPNTNKNYLEAPYYQFARRGWKPQILLNDRNNQILLWRVPDRSNVFTVIGTPDQGFVPASYSSVVADSVTRNTRQTVSMGNLLRRTENQSETITARSNPATEKIQEEPPLKIEETETGAKNKNKDMGWIKVTSKKKKKPKNITPVEDSPIIHPEPKNTTLFVEMPIKQASQIVPEIRSNSSRMKIKRDMRKMRAKMRKQEAKIELITKPKESAQSTHGKHNTSNEHGKSKLQLKDENDEDKNNYQYKTPIKMKMKNKKKDKKKTSNEEPVDITLDSSSAPAKIKSVKEAVTVGKGKKPKKGPKNKKPPPTTEELDLPSTSKQPDKDEGQDDGKITKGKRLRKLMKYKKHNSTSSEMDFPLSVRKRPEKEIPIQTKSLSEESKPTCSEESQERARKSRPTKANRNRGKSVDKCSNMKANAEKNQARKRRPKLCRQKKVSK